MSIDAVGTVESMDNIAVVEDIIVEDIIVVVVVVVKDAASDVRGLTTHSKVCISGWLH